MDETIKDDVESTTSTEEVDLETTTDEETVTLTREEHAELIKKAEQFPNVVTRAKKAEEALKALKDAKTETPQKTNVPDETLDSRILKSQGMSDELLESLKKIAAVTGKSLIDAQTDEVFIAIKGKLEASEKAEKATLPASKGSGAAKVKKDTTSPNLTAEEHKELWNKSQGR